jgi:hypothetical protein
VGGFEVQGGTEAVDSTLEVGVLHASFAVAVADRDVKDGRFHFAGVGPVLDALVGPDPMALRLSALHRLGRIEVGVGSKTGTLVACAPLEARHDEAH